MMRFQAIIFTAFVLSCFALLVNGDQTNSGGIANSYLGKVKYIQGFWKSETTQF